MRLQITFAAAILLLAGCVRGGQVPVIPSPPPVIATKPVDLKPICQTVKVYTPQQQFDLDDVVSALSDSNPIVPAMGDYKRMRDEARACANAAR